MSVAAGVYPSQTVSSGTKTVTFLGEPGVNVRQMINDASNVTYDGINVDANGQTTAGAAFELGGSNTTVKNSRVGNVVDEKAMLATGANLTVDNVTFHDAVMSAGGESRDVHMECVYAIGVPGFTIRNSTFRDCSVMDLFFTYGSWWTPRPPAYGNVTIENNVFGHSERASNSGWHYFGLYIAWIGPNGAADPMSNWVVRNNTFEQEAFIAPNSGTSGTRWVGNIGSWDCKPGIAFAYNVGERCGTTDKAVTPASSSATSTAPMGFVDPAAGNFRLKAGSPAIDAGNPADAPARDRDGRQRTGTPEAGAYEF